MLYFNLSASSSTNFHKSELDLPTNDCNFSYSINDVANSITITDLNAPHIKVKVLDDDWDPVFKCTDDCPDPITVSGLDDGEYVISVMYLDDDWDVMCISNVEVEVSPADCTVGYMIDSNSGVTITGLIATSSKIRIFDATTFNTVYECTGECGSSVFLNGLGEGYYNLDVTLYDQEGDAFCFYNDYFNLEEGSCIDVDNDGYCSSLDCDDNNAALPGTPGSSCNDNNSTTVNDVVGSDGCTCQGTIYPGPCHLSYSTTNDAITISGLIGNHVKVRIYNPSYNLVFDCFDDCGSDEITVPLIAGEAYSLKVLLMDEDWDRICSLEEKFDMIPDQTCDDEDNDGYCSDIDCDDDDANWPKTPGTACNDGNNLTSNDVIQYDGCSCEGEVIDPCEQLEISHGGGAISVGNFPSGYYVNIRYLKSGSLFYECNGNCNDPTSVTGLAPEIYQIEIALSNLSGDLVCSRFEQVTITSFNMQTQNNDLEQEQLRGASEEDDVAAITAINIYPNPVKDILTVELPILEGEASQIELYNQLGQLLHQQAIRQKEAHLVQLACADMYTGMYYLVVRSEDGVLARKPFVKR